MSLILEALKKIESDKSRNLQKTDIGSAILQPELKSKRRNRVMISCLLLGAALFLIATGMGISYYLSAGGEGRKPFQTAQPNLPSEPAMPVSRPATTQQRQLSVVEQTAKPSSDTQPELPKKNAASTSASMAAGERATGPEPEAFKAARSEANSPVLKEARPKREKRKLPEKVQSVETSVAPKRTGTVSKKYVPEEDMPPLRISGVIWSEESRLRRALVNGSAVKEGDIVDGVRIERIESDRVRFSKNGKSFNVSIR
jgi:hypothetical protein